MVPRFWEGLGAGAPFVRAVMIAFCGSTLDGAPWERCSRDAPDAHLRRGRKRPRIGAADGSGGRHRDRGPLTDSACQGSRVAESTSIGGTLLVSVRSDVVSPGR